MEIRPQTVVTLTYKLHVDQGDLVDQADETRPFAFIHGIGQTLEAFDGNLAGLKAGDSFDFQLNAEDGYGVYQEEAVVDLPRNIFDGAPEGTLVVGNTVPMQDQSGNPLFGVVAHVGLETIKMDFNHPLAGKSLHFTGKVIEVREATRAELDHGHVHGEHGHHH